MPDSQTSLQLVARSDAARVDDGYWQSGWLAVLWEGENFGFADVSITAGEGAQITFTVFWLDGLKPMYRIDVNPAGKELTILKNFDGWLEDIGVISYDDVGNTLNENGEPIDPDEVDPYQPVNGAVAADQDAAEIAALMLTPPFAAEELFTRVMAVVGEVTAYTERWAHRYLRLSAKEDEPAWTDLWRPVDIGPIARLFPIEDADQGPVVHRVEVKGWHGYHLAEEAVSALLDDSGHARPGLVPTDGLAESYVGGPLSIDDLSDAAQTEWYRVWNRAHITYEPNMS